MEANTSSDMPANAMAERLPDVVVAIEDAENVASAAPVERPETFLQFAQYILVHGITSSEIGSIFHGNIRLC